MHIAAGLGAAKDKFAGAIGGHLNFINLVPIRVLQAVTARPGVFQKGEAFLLDGKLQTPWQASQPGNRM